MDDVIRVLAVAGTRPEAIKLAPVLLAAAKRPGIACRLLATGQHGTLFDEALAAFDLEPDARVEAVLHDPSPDVVIGRLVAALEPALRRETPDIVLVQGDTNSAYAGAIAAARLGIPVGHVEAGLRSGDIDRPWPEERNRIGIDALSTLLFAPTEAAAANLVLDPAATGDVTVTGNTGIDALLAIHASLPPPSRNARRSILLTCHRRESIGAGIAAICDAAALLAARGDVDILFPVHPNPLVADMVRARLDDVAGIRVVPALGYRDAVAAVAAATLVLTDSGGVQEEAATLGIPTLVLREETERPEGVASGNLRIVGTDSDRIVAAAAAVLDDPAVHAAMSARRHPFGRGDAAQRILDAVERRFARPARAQAALPLRLDAIKDGARI